MLEKYKQTDGFNSLNSNYLGKKIKRINILTNRKKNINETKIHEVN